jgi:hypothetical protein
MARILHIQRIEMPKKGNPRRSLLGDVTGLSNRNVLARLMFRAGAGRLI